MYKFAKRIIPDYTTSDELESKKIENLLNDNVSEELLIRQLLAKIKTFTSFNILEDITEK